MTLKTLGTALLAAGLLTSVGLAQADTVRWARSADVTTLDPHVFNTGTNFVLMHQMYETLVNRSADGKQAILSLLLAAGAAGLSVIDRLFSDFPNLRTVLAPPRAYVRVIACISYYYLILKNQKIFSAGTTAIKDEIQRFLLLLFKTCLK